MSRSESSPRPSPSLAAALQRHRARILEEWTRAIREVVGAHYREHQPGEVAAWADRALSVIITSLETGSDDFLCGYLEDLSATRWEMGFEIEEVVQALLLLQEVCLPVLLERTAAVDGEVEKRVSGLAVCLREAVACFVRHYAETMRDSLEEKKKRTAQLYERTRRSLTETRTMQGVVAAVLGSLDFRRTLAVVCQEAVRLTGARGSSILLMDEDGRVRLAHALGYGACRARELLALANGHEQEVVPSQPVLVDELELGPDEAGRAHDVVSFLAVPLRRKRILVGSLQLVADRGKLEHDDLRLMVLLARQVGLVIEHEFLHERHERMALLEERNRLGRELHDSVTQSLYAVTLHSETAARLLESGNHDAAGGHLRAVRDGALDALREMRLLIFELRPPDFEKGGFVCALQARLKAVEERVGLATRLETEGEEDIPRGVAEGLYGIAREALNNCVKHADASRVVIRLAMRPSRVLLEIEDDGVGFVRSQTAATGGLGLKCMEERTELMGGRMEIRSQPDRGTRVTVEVPLGKPGADRGQEDRAFEGRDADRE